MMLSETQARLPKSHSNDTVSAETLNDARVNTDLQLCVEVFAWKIE
jgi:hypothetical protein